MAWKDTIYLTILALTFVIGTGLVYWRENRKSFQEKIFEYKYAAYKEIAEDIGMFCEDAYEFLEFFQEFEGDEKTWEIEAAELYKKFYAKAFLLKRLYYKNLPLLPEAQLKSLNELCGRCVTHVTMHHFGTSAPHDSYENLYDSFYNFIESGREDLSVNSINFSLRSRLVTQLYPVNFSQVRNKKA